MKINGIFVDPKDYKYIDRDAKYYDVDKNRAVIERTIAKNEKKRKDKEKIFEGALRERTNAIASYLLYLNKGGAGSAEKYFGRKYLAHLRGKEIEKEARKRHEMLKRYGIYLP